MPRLDRSIAILFASSLVLASTGAFAQDAPKDLQKQIDEVRSVLPKFAIPMREVGDRFQNMYFAAKGGNWALAAHSTCSGQTSEQAPTKVQSTAHSYCAELRA